MIQPAIGIPCTAFGVTLSKLSAADKSLCLQTVVIDARAHMLGRLASIVAKQLLNGQHVVSQSLEVPSTAFSTGAVH